MKTVICVILTIYALSVWFNASWIVQNLVVPVTAIAILAAIAASVFVIAVCSIEAYDNWKE